MHMLHKILCITTMALLFTQSVSSYRFLGFFPFNGKSHNLFFEAIMKGLAYHGHQVDLVSHFSDPNPPKNYNVIVNLEGAIEQLMNNVSYQYVMELKEYDVYYFSTAFGNRLCDMMGLDEIQKIVKSVHNPPYDAVIVEAFTANCFMGFGHLFKVPVIGLTSCVEYPWITDFIGNMNNLGVYHTVFTAATGKMDFWDRLRNTVVYYHSAFLYYSYTDDYQTKAMRKYLAPDLPRIRDIEKSVSLILANTHVSVNGVKPSLPLVVQLAGLHIEQDTAKFTPELKKWMDESVHGVVYFSFGSFLILETLPLDMMRTMYAIFAKLHPIRVLMKVVDARNLPPGLPDNVLTLSWIPQIPVLNHHHMRVFITHGGLFGTIEAVYHGIPMVGIPFLREQWHNIQNMVAKNVSILVNLNNITEDSLYAAIRTILNEPNYRNSAMKLSKIFRERPMTSMDTALFWINFVIKHGSHMLKSPALELAWWQIALLDIYGFLLILLFVIIFITLVAIYIAYKFTYKYLFQKVPSQKKTN